LSPLLLGIQINAAPVKPRRINGKVTRREESGCLSQGDLARWPHSVRPSADAYYRAGAQLRVRL
jgi:hypothetical protein